MAIGPDIKGVPVYSGEKHTGTLDLGWATPDDIDREFSSDEAIRNAISTVSSPETKRNILSLRTGGEYYERMLGQHGLFWWQRFTPSDEPHKSVGDLVGFCGYSEDRVAINIQLGSRYKGLGIGRAAADIRTGFALGVIGIDLIARVNKTNLASDKIIRDQGGVCRRDDDLNRHNYTILNPYLGYDFTSIETERHEQQGDDTDVEVAMEKTRKKLDAVYKVLRTSRVLIPPGTIAAKHLARRFDLGLAR